MANYTKKIQKKFYDTMFSEEFVWKDSNYSECTRYFTNRFIDETIWPECKKILEIGCGNGLFTFFLLKKKIDITAIDISEKAISSLENQFKKEITSGQLKVECRDIVEYLKNTNEKFDMIIGSGIIHHLEKNNWDKFFNLAYEKLNRGGIVAFAPEPNAGGLYRFIWRFAKFFYKLFGMDYDWEVEKGTINMKPWLLKYQLKKCGFKNPEILPFQIIPHFQIKTLENLDKKLIDYIDGKFSMYIILKGSK